MSKPTNATVVKRGAPRKKQIKKRQNICLDIPVLKAGQKMAQQNNMSFSGWIAGLIRERMATQTGAES